MGGYPQFAGDTQVVYPNCIAENILGVNEVCLLPMQMGIKTVGQIMNSSGL